MLSSEPLWQRFHSLRHRELELEEMIETAWKSNGSPAVSTNVRKHMLSLLLLLQEEITKLQQEALRSSGITLKKRMSAAERERASAIQLREAATRFPAHQLQHALDRLAARAAHLEKEMATTRDPATADAIAEIHQTIQTLRVAPARKKATRVVVAPTPQPSTVWESAALALRAWKKRLSGSPAPTLRSAALAELTRHEEALTGHLSILRLSSAPLAQRQHEQTAIASVLHSIEDMRHALHDNRPLPALRNLPTASTPLTQTKTTRSRKTRAVVTQSPAPAFSLRRMFGGLLGFLDAEA